MGRDEGRNRLEGRDDGILDDGNRQLDHIADSGPRELEHRRDFRAVRLEEVLHRAEYRQDHAPDGGNDRSHKTLKGGPYTAEDVQRGAEHPALLAGSAKELTNQREHWLEGLERGRERGDDDVREEVHRAADTHREAVGQRVEGRHRRRRAQEAQQVAELFLDDLEDGLPKGAQGARYPVLKVRDHPAEGARLDIHQPAVLVLHQAQDDVHTLGERRQQLPGRAELETHLGQFVARGDAQLLKAADGLAGRAR